MSENSTELSLEQVLERARMRDPHQPEFHQALHEVLQWVVPFAASRPVYNHPALFSKLTEPERIIQFRVPWTDDDGQEHISRGYRVQFSSVIGPCKGGLRFHPSVNLSVLKFLAFEQVFKNSLTGLPMGGAKGGADFSPKGRSDAEIMRFCQSFMTGLYNHIGPETDIPAGDIGVGSREIGYLFGQYRRITGTFSGVLTGKGEAFGGSILRPEATGYGLLYFTKEMLDAAGKQMDGIRVLISGSGNVAQFACRKAIEMGAKVLSMSDSDGYIFKEEGLTDEDLDFIMELKNEKRGRIKACQEAFACSWYEGTPWRHGAKAGLALPCATQNELDADDARTLIENGLLAVAEGANMPCTEKAVKLFHKHQIPFAPGKAANAGGVSVSGLEMSQNSIRMSWSAERVDDELHRIMHDIHEKCRSFGETDGSINYEKGAAIAGFIKVADAMIAQGHV
ncbi:MAG: NADP-specific glutamate dehydrogenase [Candidatus Cyclonatronum sp.]|uniref:NADP-specific glutamate dehydrogenase n=1 Tax=Cyclonatronum sp. TaxID=3024185 RepID=UPI0025C3E017|nr:NADP-specific glutamate dehydrogenase [Cyclonatronum sp.]MCH8485970.1 NADP-specific glutamate dehydrogenase [Cyclonatronum sp.]